MRGSADIGKPGDLSGIPKTDMLGGETTQVSSELLTYAKTHRANREINKFIKYSKQS